MGEERGSLHVSDSNGLDHRDNDDQSRTLDIYPLSSYYFASKEAIPVKVEAPADRLYRLKSNYAAYGLRTCVEAVILVELFKHPHVRRDTWKMGEERGSLHVSDSNGLDHRDNNDQSRTLDIYPLSSYYFASKEAIPVKVELFKHPHVLLLQIRNCIFKLPGGRLRPGESEIDGLKRKLSRKLCINADGDGIPWEVGECLGAWWRHDFESLLCRDLPSRVESPKECTKLYVVQLPDCRRFIAPKNQKLLAIPLCQIANNNETYGPIISGVPEMLSNFTINIVED
ncbi:hypothetical protein C1H46_029324 [Malus baccata]|uniref:Pre-mRNA cleavage factor Im 25 kDa subunit n=1 Tax=Malus baccata TaxID=106549 RepID=A0A540LFB3_MALBA|nr:hypothetical protein C1H46_029324 [Malus baccata]